MKPIPPCTWIARSQATTAASAACAFAAAAATAACRVVLRDAPRGPPRERARQLELACELASGCETAWYEPIRRPNCSRSETYATASSSARAPTPHGLEREHRERARAQRRQHLGRAQRSPGLAAGDDAERARLVARREHLALGAVELPDRVPADDGDVRRGVEVRHERAERERPARLAGGDAAWSSPGRKGRSDGRSTRAARGAAPARPPRGAPPPRGSRARRRRAPRRPRRRSSRAPRAAPRSARVSPRGTARLRPELVLERREREIHQRDLGRPSTRSATMLRRISDVPASIVLPRLRSCCTRPVAAVRRVRREELRVGAEQLERELRHALVRLRPLQLEDRAFGARDPGPLERRERAVRGDAERLELDPLARDRVALHRCRTAVARELERASDLHLEPGDEREAERAALVEERRHRDVPAAADLADHVLERHLDAAQEDLVELGLARDLAQRPHLDAGRVHVDDQVGEAGVALRVGVGAGEEDAEVRDVRVRRPDLLPVDDEAVALEARRRADAGEIGAGTGLREPLAPDLVGREERLQVARLLRVGAARDDRRPGHPEPDHADVRRRLGARLLLEVDRLEPRREPAPAVLLRPRDPDPAAVVERAAPGAHLGAVEAGRAAAVALELLRQARLEPRAHLLAERSPPPACRGSPRGDARTAALHQGA